MRGDLLQKMIKRWSRKTATNVKYWPHKLKKGNAERERENTYELNTWIEYVDGRTHLVAPTFNLEKLTDIYVKNVKPFLSNSPLVSGLWTMLLGLLCLKSKRVSVNNLIIKRGKHPKWVINSLIFYLLLINLTLRPWPLTLTLVPIYKVITDR